MVNKNCFILYFFIIFFPVLVFFDLQPWHIANVYHTLFINVIEVNCRETSLTLRGSHSTSTLFIDKWLIIAYLRGKSPLKFTIEEKKVPQRSFSTQRIASKEYSYPAENLSCV